MEKLLEKADEWVKEEGNGQRGTVRGVRRRVGSLMFPKVSREFRSIVLGQAHGKELEYAWDTESKWSMVFWVRHLYHMGWPILIGLRALPGILVRTRSEK